MNGLQEKYKTPIFFDSFWAKMGKKGNFFKKSLGTFFSRLEVLQLTAKFQKKSNEQFSRNCLRMNGRDSLGLKRIRRETKKIS